MGHMQAVGMADAVRHGTPLAAALEYHLQHNHFPPLPNEAIGIAREAIKRCAAGEPNAEVGTPRGLHPAWRIVQAWHLEPFVDAVEEGA